MCLYVLSTGQDNLSDITSLDQGLSFSDHISKLSLPPLYYEESNMRRGQFQNISLLGYKSNGILPSWTGSADTDQEVVLRRCMKQMTPQATHRLLHIFIEL